MAQKQTNPFQEIVQSFDNQQFSTQLTTNGLNRVCSFVYNGHIFKFNKPIWGYTSAGHIVPSELTTVEAVEEILADEVVFVPAINSGNEIGTLTAGENTYHLYSPKIVPDWNENNSDSSDFIKNRPCYKTISGETLSGTVNIWSMVAEGTSYYYGTKTNALFGYEIEEGQYYRLTDANQHANEFTTQSVSVTTNKSFLSVVSGLGVGNLNMLNSSYPDTGEDLAVLFYNFNDGRYDIIVVCKYVVGDSLSLNVYKKLFDYHPLEIGYIPDDVMLKNTTENNSLTLKAGVFNNLGTVDYNDIVYSSTLANSIVYGQFTSNVTGTINSGSGDSVIWRGDTEIVSGNTYQFQILNGFGKIEKVLGL